MTLHLLSRHRVLAALLVSMLAVTGCKNPPTVEDVGATTGPPPVGANTNPAGANSGISQTALPGAGGVRDRLNQPQNRVVYFDYDRAEIRPEFNAILTEHGRYLANNPTVQMRLEGHSDERGSREYNIGLGERRAQAVLRVLMLQGATATQLTTVSYGEERPAVTGSNEQSWQQNRRVELVFR